MLNSALVGEILELIKPFLFRILVATVIAIIIIVSAIFGKRKSPASPQSTTNQHTINCEKKHSDVAPAFCVPESKENREPPIVSSEPFRFYLTVPKSTGYSAKELGLKYDQWQKMWYIDNLSRHKSKYIVFGDLFVLERQRACYHCGSLTPVIAFALKGYLHAEEDIFVLSSIRDEILLLPDISPMPYTLAHFLARRYNYHSPRYHQTAASMNHCIHCGFKQGNYYLYEEVYDLYRDGQFSGETMDIDAIFYKVIFDGTLVLTSSDECSSNIPCNSDFTHTSDEVYEWESR